MVIVHALRAHRTPVQCHPLLRYLGHDTSLMPAYAFVWIGSQTVPVQLSPGILRSSSAKLTPSPRSESRRKTETLFKPQERRAKTDSTNDQLQWAIIVVAPVKNSCR